MDHFTEELKKMFYQSALTTERQRQKVEQLKALGEKWSTQKGETSC